MMRQEELKQNIKVGVFALKKDSESESMQLLKHISMNESQINISVLVRVEQKKEYDRELHLFLVHIGEKEYSTFSVRTIPLNPSKTHKKDEEEQSSPEFSKLPNEPYSIFQMCRFNLMNIPLNGKGTYAVAVSDNDKDLNGVLDAYYFNVD